MDASSGLGRGVGAFCATTRWAAEIDETPAEDSSIDVDTFDVPREQEDRYRQFLGRLRQCRVAFAHDSAEQHTTARVLDDFRAALSQGQLYPAYALHQVVELSTACLDRKALLAAHQKEGDELNKAADELTLASSQALQTVSTTHPQVLQGMHNIVAAVLGCLQYLFWEGDSSVLLQDELVCAQACLLRLLIFWLQTSKFATVLSKPTSFRSGDEQCLMNAASTWLREYLGWLWLVGGSAIATADVAEAAVLAGKLLKELGDDNPCLPTAEAVTCELWPALGRGCRPIEVIKTKACADGHSAALAQGSTSYVQQWLASTCQLAPPPLATHTLRRDSLDSCDSVVIGV